jgi:glutathione peroxidase-family protein
MVAGQEPGSNDEIQQFCQLNYGVSFPVLGKIDVNGDKADPVFQYLKSNKSGLLGLTRIKYLSLASFVLMSRWNFV